MKPQKRAKTPSLPAPDAAKPQEPERRAPLPTPPPHPPLRTSEFVAAGDIVEMGDEFIEESLDAAAVDPPVVPVSATAERTIPAPLPRDLHGDTEEVRYRRATLVSPISAQLAESMVSVAEAAVGRDPAAPLMEGDDVTRRVTESDHRDVINETGPGYTVEVLDDSAAAARWRVDMAHAVEAAPAEAALVGPLHRVAFLTRNPEETLARPLPAGAEVLVENIDGRRTLEQLFGDARLHPRDALRITAALLRDGIIRIV